MLVFAVFVVSVAVVLLLTICFCNCLVLLFVVYANSIIVVTVGIVSAVPVAIYYGIVCCTYFKYLFWHFRAAYKALKAGILWYNGSPQE